MTKQKFGKAFEGEIGKNKSRKSFFPKKLSGEGDWLEQFSLQGMSLGADIRQSDLGLTSWRKVGLAVCLMIFLGILATRLFHLQVVKGGENRELADSNRIQVKVIHAQRGVIYDRNGKILAQNEPGFRLVRKTLTRDEALKLEVEGSPLVKDLEIDSIRTYPLSEKTSHVLGYVSEINAEELADVKYKNYLLGDKIGRGGVEESYEKVLKGVDGGEIIEVDASGEKIRTLRRKEPIPGQNLYLTIDADLQQVAFEKLKVGVEKAGSCCGVIVATDPNSGQILSMVSYPSFDFKNLSSALTTSNSPILNRVIGGVYPPGSTYKIASSLAGLETGKISGKTIFEDTGILHLGPYSFANWYFSQYGKTEGPVDVVKALQRSNDIFFYQLGIVTGEKIMGEYSKKLGLGKRLGVDIPGEVEGMIPDGDWKLKHIGEVWYPGDSLHMAIGQGFVLTTPLQVNNLISTVASDGKQYPPHLALKITDNHNKVIKEFKYDQVSSYIFKKENIDLIKKGLEAVTKDGGTAWPFFVFPVATAGKTGTAEIGDPKGKTHAWYTSYAPVDRPTIALTILVEKGGEGSSTSAPIAKEIYRWYLSSDKTNLIKDIGGVATSSAKPVGD